MRGAAGHQPRNGRRPGQAQVVRGLLTHGGPWAPKGETLRALVLRNRIPWASGGTPCNSQITVC